jgi:hypothetical protein
MRKSTHLKSDPESAVWLKCIVPFMFLVGPVLIFGKNLLTWRVVFAVPPILLAVFLSSLATIEVANGRMRYRRFVTWRNLDQDEIQDSGKFSVLIGDVGYPQLNHYLVPWGKLYFVPDGGTFTGMFAPRDYGLIKSSSKAVVDPPPDDAHDSIRTRVPLNVQGLVGAMAGGTFSEACD